MPRPTRTAGTGPTRTAGPAPRSRPLALIGAGAGAAVALATLALCLVLALAGWYLADAGAHGRAVGALRIGSLAWLTGLGSGVHVLGTPVTAVPLGITLVVAVALWRVGLRVGEAVWDHGPDAEALADGQRDLTVPAATALYAAGFVVVAVLVATFAATPATAPSTPHVVLWSLVLCLPLGGTSIAIGSGRAAVWAAGVPDTARVAARVGWRVTQVWLTVSLAVFLVALLTDLSTAANVLSQLHASPGSAVSLVAVCVLLVPNATLFSSAYLLGPGFTVGSGTLVTPAVVVLGPLPTVPLLAALPDQGPTPGWTSALIALPPLVAALVTAVVLRRHPTDRWDAGALRGLAGGMLAGLLVAILSAVAGGAVGPGRMQHVGPLVHGVLLHAVTSFGLGGLVAGLLMTWWERRSIRVAADSVSGA